MCVLHLREKYVKCRGDYVKSPVQWHNNGLDGVWNHRYPDCCSTVCSCAGQRKHQSSTTLTFERGTTDDQWFPSQKAVVTWEYSHLMTSSSEIYECKHYNQLTLLLRDGLRSGDSIIISHGACILLFQLTSTLLRVRSTIPLDRLEIPENVIIMRHMI